MKTYRNLKYSDDFTICYGPMSLDISNIDLYPGTIIIAEEAFAACANLTFLDLSHTNLIRIYSYAFRSCYNLKRIKLPNTIERLGFGTFTDCKNLEEVEFSNTKIEELAYTFENCERLKEITLPNTLAKLKDGTFRSCGNLKEVTLPDNLKFFDIGSFKETTVETLTLPESIEKINFKDFHLTNLKTLCYTYLPNLQFSLEKTIKEGECPKFEYIGQKTFQQLLDEGKSFKEINKKFKNNNIER